MVGERGCAAVREGSGQYYSVRSSRKVDVEVQDIWGT